MEKTPHDVEEVKKCIESPYYYAMKYLTVNGQPFTTPLTEEEFNKEFKGLGIGRMSVVSTVSNTQEKINYKDIYTNKEKEA
jgi:hypothetical protein